MWVSAGMALTERGAPCQLDARSGGAEVGQHDETHQGVHEIRQRSRVGLEQSCLDSPERAAEDALRGVRRRLAVGGIAPAIDHPGERREDLIAAREHGEACRRMLSDTQPRELWLL